ncbi:MAG: GNAT family N-acetyltransferase [Ferruginibacter sp.]
MQNTFTTERLIINPLTVDDHAFIIELVNSKGWLRFIGNRYITNEAEAIEYIQKIIDNPDIDYWTVFLKNELIPIGVVTFIKREYLEHWDIGFALLPQFEKNGYAYEATNSLLESLKEDDIHNTILATTLKDNHGSIHLLEKLGLQFEKEILVKNDTLLLYATSLI